MLLLARVTLLVVIRVACTVGIKRHNKIEFIQIVTDNYSFITSVYFVDCHRFPNRFNGLVSIIDYKSVRMFINVTVYAFVV